MKATPLPESVGVKVVEVEIPEPMLKKLEKLRDLGLWGPTTGAVIERLAAAQLREIDGERRASNQGPLF